MSVPNRYDSRLVGAPARTVGQAPVSSPVKQERFVSSPLILALQDASLYDHPVDGFNCFETHISQVILTGPYAYKIKKPMNFGFLDFSTLERRKHFCEEEVRLNRRLAPDLYVDVVAITGTPEAPHLNGDGEPFEYAVRMRQFDQSQLFDHLQDEGSLTVSHIDELGQIVADFHTSVPAATADSPMGTPEAVFAPMDQNFEQIRPLLDDPSLLAQLEALAGWTRSTFERLEPLLARRHEQGAIRECHGDLHLGNIALYDGKVTIFDCIEFNETFRWIDTVDDLAFLLMDLEFRGQEPFAARLLNTYLERTGDFQALPLIRFYKAYRAMVRAKIALLTMVDANTATADKAVLMQRYRDYAQLAEDYTAIPNRFLLITHGVSGSGKSRISRQLSQALGMIRFRSDVERKRLFGLQPEQDSGSMPGGGIYTPEANGRTYHRLAELATEALVAGFSVAVDAAFLKRDERRLLEDTAEAQGVPFLLVHCDADPEILRDRVRKRAAEGTDASEAGLDILERQFQWLEPLEDDERGHTIKVDTAGSEPAGALAERLRAHLENPSTPD